MKLAFGRSALPDADQHAASGDEQGRGLVAPAETDWLDHTLAISGPLDLVARFRAAARGTNAAPWSLDLDAEEARLFAPMAREGSAARALARELREVIAANHDRMLARWHEPGGCLFDLHRLVPIPPQVLQLGRDHPRARAWLWENWGTTQPLRHVRLVKEAADRRRRRTRRDVLAFCSADWTPWQAIRRIRREWPDLIFTVEPRYKVTEAESGGETRSV